MIRRQTKKTKAQKQKIAQNQPSSQSKDELTFLEHLYEFRSRLFWITASLIITSAIGFQYKDILVDFVMAPLDGEKLVYLTPGGGFSFIFTVCLYFGALVTIPVIMYHIYRFLQPVLGTTSRRFVVLLLVLSSSLAAAGAIFGYVVAIPAAIHFLSTFAGDAVTPNLTAESYLGFIIAYMLGLAALFQLPLLLYIIDHVRPFPPGALLTSQRFVIVGAVIAAAIITPTPDIINQLIVAGPIIAIYQLGAIAVFIRRKTTRRHYQTVKSAPDNANSVPARQHTSTQPVVQYAEPAVIPSAGSKPQVAQPKPKSIDGFARAPRTLITPPSRTGTTLQPIHRSSQPAHRSRRVSVDGLSMIY